MAVIHYAIKSFDDCTLVSGDSAIESNCDENLTPKCKTL